jgi:CelD/BcsL family acetyltransferase involved in cellulose biosynthesis
MHRLARENDCQCTGMLSTVHAGETWVASHLGLRNGPLLHYWFPVYNEDLSKYSPGHILIKQIIEQTPSDGIFEMDFGCGEGQHKKSYVRETYCVYRDYWKGPGLSGAICGMLGSLQNPGYIKRRIKTLTKKTVTDRLSKNGDKDPNGVNDE